jgi:hypothetical protein
MLLEPPVKHWMCNACGGTYETREARPHTPMHSCAALHGCSLPFIEVDSGARVRLVEREDYVGDAIAHVVDGRPVMSVVVDRPDGSNDCYAFADTAQVHLS